MMYLGISLLLAVATVPARSTNLKIVCYYSNWAVYRPSLAKFTPQNINPYLCTHIIYAFAGFNKRYELKPYDPYNDIEQGNYKKFVGLKEYNPGLKTMVAVGGWNEGSKRFSHMVSERSQRLKFVRSAIKFCREHNFDGIDLDWEYPSFRDGGEPEDKQGYALLIKELREAFEAESVPANKERLVLSVAVPAGKQYIDGGFDVKTVTKSADFLNLLTYDYHTAYEATTQHHSPLAPRENLQEWDEENKLNVRWTVDYYLRQGAPRNKLIVGIPTYGRSYTLVDPEDAELDSAADGPGEPGNSTREKGYLAYYEICQNVNEFGWEVERPHPSLMGPYAFKDGQWVGFDDEQIIREKARYILKENLGGAMIWTLDNDDFRGICGGEQSPLIAALRRTLLTTDEGTSARRTTSRKKGRSPNQSSLRPGGRANLALSHTTPAPPPTPDPGPAFECDDEGFFNNPRDCRKYFWCLDSGPANLGIVAHTFTCPSGLYFNSKSEACDYKENVVCRALPAELPATTTKKPRRSKARSTTTTTPPVADIEDKEDKDVAELLRLLKSIGGVDKLQSFLSGDEPTRELRRPPHAQDEEPELTAQNATQGQQIRRPHFRQEPDLFKYVEPSRQRVVDAPDTNVFVAPIGSADPAQQSQNQQSLNPFHFVYQTPERHQAPQASYAPDSPPASVPTVSQQVPQQSPTIPPFVYQTPARNLQTDTNHQPTVAPVQQAALSEPQPVPVHALPPPQQERGVQQAKPPTTHTRPQAIPQPVSRPGPFQPDPQGVQVVISKQFQEQLVPERVSEPAIPGAIPQTVPQRPNKVVRVTGPPGQTAPLPPGARRGKRIRPAQVDEPIRSHRRVAIRRRPVISPPSEPLEQVVQTTTTTTITTTTPLTTEEHVYDYEYEDRVAETTRRTTTTTTTTRRPRRRPVHRKSVTVATQAPDRFAPPLIVIDDQTVDCNKRGVFVHPDNCGKFVVCAPNSKSASGLRGYVHNCPSEQIYMDTKGRCMGGSRTKCQ